MDKMQKTTLGAAAAVVVIGLAAAVGVPVYSSQKLDAELKTLAAQPINGDISIANFKHNAGTFNSTGSMEFQIQDHCDTDHDEEPISIKLDYSVNHFPGFKGLNSFEWTATPEGDLAANLKELLGTEQKLSGKGAITYGGKLETDMQLPAIRTNNSQMSLAVDSSKGNLSIDKSSAQFNWNLGKISARGHGESVELNNTALQMNLKDFTLGTGTVSMGIDSIKGKDFHLEGLSLQAETKENKDRLDGKVTESARSIQAKGQSFHDLSMQAALTGLHTESIKTLVKIRRESCGLNNLTSDEAAAVRTAIKTLLTSGLAVRIPVLKGTGNDGSIEGNVSFELVASSNGEIDLAKQLQSNGELVIKGKLLQPAQMNMAIASGYAQKIPEGLKASYSFSNGKLKVGEQTIEAGLADMFLNQADASIVEFINNIGAGN